MADTPNIKQRNPWRHAMTNYKPTIKDNARNTYHRDGTVSYYSIYTCTWHRRLVAEIPERDTAAMSRDEWDRLGL